MEFPNLSMSSILNHFNIVLVRAENPINIGQATRAMKNFGLSKLALVNCAPHRVEAAYTPGWKAKKILDNAKCHSSLSAAVKKSVFSVGFTTRSGKRRGEAHSIVRLVPKIVEFGLKHQVQLVFGNEKNGLSNEELNLCHEIATIPTAREYRSLNLSHAVAVVSFLIHTHLNGIEVTGGKPERYFASPKDFDILMGKFQELMTILGYKEGSAQGKDSSAFGHIKRYFKKTGLDKRELHLFQALLSRIRKHIESTAS